MLRFINEFPLLVPFIAILGAEILKALIDLMHHRGRIRFLNPGGMPSGHSALVASTVVMVAIKEGVKSSLFVVTAVLAIVVMYDAVNVRYEAGRHAHLINQLRGKTTLNESLGHTHLEVIAGALFGGLVAFLLLSGV